MNQLGKYDLNRIYTGDAAKLLADLPEACIDLTVTSPPYDLVDYDEAGNLVTYPKKGLREYKGYSWDFAAIAAELFRVTKPGGVVVWVVGDATVNGSETGSSFRQALGFMELGFNLHDTMIYERPARYPDTVRYYQVAEYMFVFSKGKPKTINLIQDKPNWQKGTVVSGRDRERNGTLRKKSCTGNLIKEYGVRNNIWQYSAGWMLSTKDKAAFQHPAIFPEALARDHIISWSNPGDVVLDPMCGSGTTPKMAKQMGRQWLGFDCSEEYVELARLRVEQANPPLPGLY